MYPPTRLGLKDMSYRKPVPKYTPTPPPSPPPSPPISPSKRLSLCLGYTQPQEMPPLPVDWRETIEQALSTSNAAGVADKSKMARPSTRHLRASTSEEQASPASMLHLPPTLHESHRDSSSTPRSPTFSPQSPKLYKRKLHQNYRPPTPPLPIHHEKGEFPDDDTGLSTLPMMYSDSLSRPIHPASPGLSIAGTSFSTLTISPSFGMEKSHSTTDLEPSTTWSGGLTTCNSNLTVDPIHTWLDPPRYNTICPSSQKHATGSRATGGDLSGISRWRERAIVWGRVCGMRLRSFGVMVAGAFACS